MEYSVANEFGVYIENVETVALQVPKKFKVEFRIARDHDGYRYGYDFQIIGTCTGDGGSSCGASIKGKSYESREAALLAGCDSAAAWFGSKSNAGKKVAPVLKEIETFAKLLCRKQELSAPAAHIDDLATMMEKEQTFRAAERAKTWYRLLRPAKSSAASWYVFGWLHGGTSAQLYMWGDPKASDGLGAWSVSEDINKAWRFKSLDECLYAWRNIHAFPADAEKSIHNGYLRFFHVKADGTIKPAAPHRPQLDLF